MVSVVVSVGFWFGQCCILLVLVWACCFCLWCLLWSCWLLLVFGFRRVVFCCLLVLVVLVFGLVALVFGVGRVGVCCRVENKGKVVAALVFSFARVVLWALVVKAALRQCFCSTQANFQTSNKHKSRHHKVLLADFPT